MTAVRDYLYGLALDVRLWITNGPRGYARLLLSWGDAHAQASELHRDLEVARQDVEIGRTGRANAQARADRLRTEIDDLAVRILETTLAVGRIAHVDVEIPSGMPDAHLYYTQQSVDPLLETARQALTAADDLARHAALRRRLLSRELHTSTLDAHAALSALRRIAEVLGDAVIPATTDVDLASAVHYAEELAARTLDGLETTR